MFYRSLSTSYCFSSKFDPKLFVDPIINRSEVNFYNMYKTISLMLNLKKLFKLIFL